MPEPRFKITPSHPPDVDTHPRPTAEEAAETPLAPYTPIVPDLSMASVLPCPAGTSQYVGDDVIECRIAGQLGEALSKRQGPSVWFHPNGKVKRAGSYDGHEWTGRWWSFDDQGRPESSAAYVAGKEEGLSVSFHPNGRRSSESIYRAGKLDGPSKSWTEEGELMVITVYKDDRGLDTRTFEYTLREASPQAAEAAQAELRALLAEQSKLTETR